MTTMQTPAFDVSVFVRAARMGKGMAIMSYEPTDVIFAQGDPADSVQYIQTGAVTLSVRSQAGENAIVAMLGPGDFFGEPALAGCAVRLEVAIATRATTVLVIPKMEMLRVLHEERALSDRFITYVLTRNIRVVSDLADQLLNSSEKRLARALLLLARDGKSGQTDRVLPKISQETLAEMVGTTRSRVNFFMNKFKKLGFVEDNGGLQVNQSLLTVIRG
jgi:CRP/FNR family transcriptional regulator, cyclic AMP receptor protein